MTYLLFLMFLVMMVILFAERPKVTRLEVALLTVACAVMLYVFIRI